LNSWSDSLVEMFQVMNVYEKNWNMR